MSQKQNILNPSLFFGSVLAVAATALLVTTTTFTQAQELPDIPGETEVFGGFVVSPFDPVVVSEGGTGETNVVLINDPSQPATIQVTSSNPALATVSPSVLNFDANNWSILQPVQIISLVDDNEVNEDVTLTFQITTASPEFVGVEVQTRTVTLLDTTPTGGTGDDDQDDSDNESDDDDNSDDNNNDDDNSDDGDGNGDSDDANTMEPGFTITPNTVLSVDEGQVLTGAYDVVLNSAPGGRVRIKIDSNNPNSLTVNGVDRAFLEFDDTDWNQAKQVSVEGVEDGNVNDEQVNVTFDVLEGPNPYLNLANQNRQVNTIDNDGLNSDGGGVGGINDDPGLLVTPTAMVTMDEGVMMNGAYEVALLTEPQTTVTLQAMASQMDMVELNGAATATMTFDATNWDQAQMLDVMALEDDLDLLDDTLEIQFSVTSGPSEYLDLAMLSRSLMIMDNDTATGGGNDDEPGIMLSPETTQQVGEGEMLNGAYQAVLTSAPTQPVTITARSSDATAVSLNDGEEATMTFDATNWNQLQDLNVMGLEDDDIFDETVELTFTVTEGSDEYTQLSPLTRQMTVLDDDTATGGGGEQSMPMVNLNPVSGVDVTEGTLFGGGYEVSLATEPSADFTLTVVSSDPSRLVINGAAQATMTFTSINWNELQFLDLEALEDADMDDQMVTLTFEMTSGASEYTGLPAMTRTVQILDDDEGGFGGANPDADNNNVSDADDNDSDLGVGGANPDMDDADDMDNDSPAPTPTATPRANGLIRTGANSSSSSGYFLISSGLILLAASLATLSYSNKS